MNDPLICMKIIWISTWQIRIKGKGKGNPVVAHKKTCKLCKEQFNEPASVYLGHYQRSSNCPNRTREVIKSVSQVSCQKDEKALPKDVMEESGGIVGSGGDREGD